MSIYEYDQEKHMQQERESSWQDGHDAGVLEGLSKGEINKLIEQIQKKLQKGKSIPEISDDLEESVEQIEFLIKEYKLI